MFTGVVGGNPAAPQIKIVNNSNLKVTAQVPENYLGRVKVGNHVVVNFPDINKTIDAVVTVASPLIDNNSRSFYIEAKIPFQQRFSSEPNRTIMVKIQDYSIKNTITVPVNTVQSDEKGKFVMVYSKEADRTVAKKRSVKLSGDFL